MKPIKKAVALAIYSEDRGLVLQVLRPADDDQLPHVWGLVAGNVQAGETWEQAVVRAGHQKLGVTVEIVGALGEKTAERSTFILTLREYEVRIIDGTPAVPQPLAGMTQYASLRWAPAKGLAEAAQKGSLCSLIFLEHAGLSVAE